MESRPTTPAASLPGRPEIRPQPSPSRRNGARAITNPPASTAYRRSTEITSASPACGRPTRALDHVGSPGHRSRCRLGGTPTLQSAPPGIARFLMGKPLSLTAKDAHRLGAYRADPAGKPLGGVVVIQEI